MFTVDELLEATQGRLVSGNRKLRLRRISTDSRAIGCGEVFIAIKGHNFDGHDFIREAIKKRAGCIIQKQAAQRPKGRLLLRPYGALSEGLPVLIEVSDTQKALGAIARFQRNKFDIPIIAVTGSNGKTTTKEMIAWVLSKSYKVLKNEGTKNNQIGMPLALLDLRSYHDIAVLEMGTNHFGEIGHLVDICRPNIGVITNIGPAHLEYFRNLKGVLKEKRTLTENLRKPHIAILNADDNLLRSGCGKQDEIPIQFWFGTKKHSDFSATSSKKVPGAIEFLVNRKYKFTLNTPGYYNIYNALAAIATARMLGMTYRDIAGRLATFVFPAGRLKIITVRNIKFIDDTYNSNPASLKQALEALVNFETKGRKIFVMGDMLELGSRRRSFHHLAGRGIAKACDVLITVGRLSEVSARAAGAFGLGPKNIFTCGSAGEARDILFRKISLKGNDCVLVKGSRLLKMEEIFN